MLSGVDCFGLSGFISVLRLRVYLQCIRICTWDEQLAMKLPHYGLWWGKAHYCPIPLTPMILLKQILFVVFKVKQYTSLKYYNYNFMEQKLYLSIAKLEYIVPPSSFRVKATITYSSVVDENHLQLFVR